MPVKTSNCSFSEERIYPGRGVEFVRRDGKKLKFLNCKNRHLSLGRVGRVGHAKKNRKSHNNVGRKALKLRWTKAWRRAHKKDQLMRSVRKDKNRRTLKSERGIEGLSLQELLRKKNESAAQREKAALAKGPKQKPQSKAGKKADLNARLRQLRQARKDKEQAREDKESGAKGGKAAKGKGKAAKGKGKAAKKETGKAAKKETGGKGKGGKKGKGKGGKK